MNTLILVATTLVSLSAFSTAIAQLSALDDSMRIQVDNDLFAAGGSHDRDYTGGVAITFSGPDVQHNVLSLSSALNLIDALFIPQGSRGMTADALQTGLMFFTPADITTSTPVSNDRPYASLVFLANGRISVDVDSRHAW